MKRVIIFIAVLLLIGVVAACSTQNVGTLSAGDIDKVTQAGGYPFGDVHELHDGPDEDGNRYAECMDCHQVHGMSFDWQNVDREYCLACHPDKASNHSNLDCMYCHNSSGGPGGGQ